MTIDHMMIGSIGLPPDSLDRLQKEILNIGFRIQPDYHPVIVPVTVQDRTILVLWAPGGQTRPYPALPGTAEPSREVLLREYFDTMILKDIVQRFNFGKPQQCIDLYHYLLSNIGRAYTLKSAYEFLKQGGHATSRDAVRDYVAWAEDAWLLFTIPIHSQSQKEQERNYRKVYGIDWALAIRNSTVWDGSYARALENMVYLHLRRNYPRVRYYLTRNKRQEVDFLVSDERGKPVLAVQVSMEISHPDTLRRELEPLVSTARYYGTVQNLIITLRQEQRFEENGVVVHTIPAWQWLLQESAFVDRERVS